MWQGKSDSSHLDVFEHHYRVVFVGISKLSALEVRNPRHDPITESSLIERYLLTLDEILALRVLKKTDEHRAAVRVSCEIERLIRQDLYQTDWDSMESRQTDDDAIVQRGVMVGSINVLQAFADPKPEMPQELAAKLLAATLLIRREQK